MADGVVVAIYQNRVYARQPATGCLLQNCRAGQRFIIHLRILTHRHRRLYINNRRMLALALYIHSATAIPIPSHFIPFHPIRLHAPILPDFSAFHSVCAFQPVAVSRLDKEFVGPFGLLLPDVTQLPATFDVLLANLQVSWSSSAAPSLDIDPVHGPATAPSAAPAPFPQQRNAEAAVFGAESCGSCCRCCSSK